MQNQMDRGLDILADGELVTGFARAGPIGTERPGLPLLLTKHGSAKDG